MTFQKIWNTLCLQSRKRALLTSRQNQEKVGILPRSASWPNVVVKQSGRTASRSVKQHDAGSSTSARHDDADTGGCAKRQSRRRSARRRTSQAGVDHARNGSPKVGHTKPAARRRSHIGQSIGEAPSSYRRQRSGHSSLDAAGSGAAPATTIANGCSNASAWRPPRRPSRRCTRRNAGTTTRSVKHGIQVKRKPGMAVHTAR